MKLRFTIRTSFVLAAISVGASFIAAIRELTWRYPNGAQLLRMLAIVLAVLLGVTVFAMGSAILRLFGAVVLKRRADHSREQAIDTHDLSMRIRFSIRDLLWLTLVVALCMGWLVTSREVTQYKWHCRHNLKTTKMPAQ